MNNPSTPNPSDGASPADDGATVPTVLHTAVEDCSARLTLQVPEDLRFCKGHFDEKAIVPGVAQIRWVLLFAQRTLGLEGSVCRMEAVKFRSILCPGERFDMILRWDDSRRKLHYSLERPEQPIAAGRLVIA